MAPTKNKQQMLLLQADAIEVLPLKNARLVGGGGGGYNNLYNNHHNNQQKQADTPPPRLFTCNSEPFLPMYETTPLFQPSPPDTPSTLGVAVLDTPPVHNKPRQQLRPGRKSLPGAAKHETERERKRMTLIVGLCATSIFMTAFLLVAITLRMTPQIDEMIRKENEELLKLMTQSSGSANGVHDNNNNTNHHNSSSTNSSATTPSTHHPATNEG